MFIKFYSFLSRQIKGCHKFSFELFCACEDLSVLEPVNSYRRL